MKEKLNQTFINDLNNESLIFLNRIYVSNIDLEDDVYPISKDIKIRKIKFLDEVDFDATKLFRSMLTRDHPKFIIEFKSDEKNTSVLLNDSKSIRDIIVDSLKTYTGNTFEISYEIKHPISIEKDYLATQKFADYYKETPNFKFKLFNFNESKLTAKDIENCSNLAQFVRDIRCTENSDEKFVEVALNFFLESLSKTHTSGKITYSMLSLEALFNTSSKDVTRNLREKCSSFLSYTQEAHSCFEDFSKNKISKNLAKGYEIRSMYVHGEDPYKKIDYNLSSIIRSYTFLSLILFMQLVKSDKIENIQNDFINDNKHKKKIINDYLIHNAQINTSNKGELKEIISGCLIFNSFYNN